MSTEQRRVWEREDRIKNPAKYRVKDKKRYESRKAWRKLYNSKRRAHILRRDKASRDWLHFCLLPGEREEIARFQAGLDPITGAPLVKSAAIDHCHKTGLIRGLLNWKTNQALAHFEHWPGSLHRFGVISEYLANPPAVKALGGPRYGVIGRVTRKAANRRYGPDGTIEPQFTMSELLERRDGAK